MDFMGLLNRFLGILLVILFGIIEPIFKTPLPKGVISWRLNESTVLRANNCDLNIIAQILCFRVVVPIAMHRPGLVDKVSGYIFSHFFSPLIAAAAITHETYGAHQTLT